MPKLQNFKGNVFKIDFLTFWTTWNFKSRCIHQAECFALVCRCKSIQVCETRRRLCVQLLFSFV